MFQLQDHLKKTAAFGQYPAPPQLHPFHIHIQPTKAFSVPGTPQLTRNPTTFSYSSPLKINTLTRTNTYVSSIGQAGLSPRLRTKRIFEVKNINADLIPEKKYPQFRNIKIINYGPIEVISDKKCQNYDKKSPLKSTCKESYNPNLKQSAHSRFTKLEELELTRSYEFVKGRLHDANKNAQLINQSYTSFNLCPTEISSLHITQAEPVRQPSPDEQKKFKQFHSIKRILDQKSGFLLRSNQRKTSSLTLTRPSVKVRKQEDKENFWAWVACFICMSIIMGLLVFT